VGRIRVDLRAEDSAVETLAGYDLVVLAVGPFEVLGAAPHRLCLAAGVNCVDINDSLDVAREIFELSAACEEAGVLILTGMGLSPGLTTMLLLDLLDRAPPGERRARLRVFVGGDQDAGRSAVRAMLASFTPKVPEIRAGELELVAHDERSSEAKFVFDRDAGPVRVIHYPTPEMWTLPRSRRGASLERLDYRVHFEGMPTPFVSVLRHVPLLRSGLATALLSRPVNLIHDLGRRRRSAGAVAVAELGTATATGRAGSSYEATAGFAAAIASLTLGGELDVDRGVHSLETALVDRTRLRADLGSRAIELSPLPETRGR
jgi:saccharopine dehydrogenase-like NADP-dependent oxidoreductase